MNISAFGLLIASPYIEFPSELKNSGKGLINIKSNDNKCFLWCHGKHLNLVEKNLQIITKEDKKVVSKLNYEGIKFPASKKDYCKIERQNNICVNAFCYEGKSTYLVYLPNQKFKDYMDLLLISNKNKSHLFIKDFDIFMCSKTKNKNKKYFCKCFLQCFSSEDVFIENKKDCLTINCKKNVRLKSGSISLKNYSKQIPVTFKSYVDFE